MIIFTHDINVARYISANTKEEIKIFNLSSLYSGYIDVTNLITSIPVMNTNIRLPEFVETPVFDEAYAQMIFNDPNLFASFMSIMFHSFNGGISIILIQRDPYRDSVTESIIRLIKMRYEVNCWIVEDELDSSIVFERPSNTDNYNSNGLLTIKKDIDAYISLIGINNF